MSATTHCRIAEFHHWAITELRIRRYVGPSSDAIELTITDAYGNEQNLMLWCSKDALHGIAHGSYR